jgi:predicted kinase
LRWFRRCRSVREPLIVDILKAGASAVLDLAGNRIDERTSARSLSEQAGSPHVLHFLSADDEECLRRPQLRNQLKPEGLYVASTTEADFGVI